MSPKDGLSRKEFCELMGVTYAEIVQIAKEQGLAPHAYIQRETGWTLYLELYYPPNVLLVQNGFPQVEYDSIDVGASDSH